MNKKIFGFQNRILNQQKTINQFDLDVKELEFLRLNLEYGHKCKKSFVNRKGFNLGTPEYNKCVLARGKIDD